jgi:uncharacterized protein with NRDE domain
MCLVLIALDSHPDYSLIVAANRDEFYDRPTSRAAFWDDAPAILAGRDLKAGGSWLGINRQGRFAAVTNYRQGRRERPAPRSRGQLVSGFLTTPTGVRDYVDRARADAALYNGFNLIVGDARELLYYSNRGGRVQALTPGVYGLSNHLLDTAWPKVTATKSALGALVNRRDSALIEDLFALLADRNRSADHQLPDTGVGREWERLLSSAFVASDHYGTRSSTVLLVGRAGIVVFVEREFRSGGVPGEESRFTFQLERADQATL